MNLHNMTFSDITLKLNVVQQQQQPFYSHYTGEPVSLHNPLKTENCRILLVQSLTACMPMLTADSASGLERRHKTSP